MKHNKPKIIVLDIASIGKDIDYSVLNRLGDTVLRDQSHNHELASIINMNKADIVISNRPTFSAETLQALHYTKLLCLTATGTNTVDLEATRQQGIAVCNIRGYSSNSVAQHTFALTLTLLNQIRAFEDHVHSLSWVQNQQWTELSHQFYELQDKTWGIIGYGAIGRRVAQIAEAFGCKTCRTSVSKNERDENLPCLPLQELLNQSDIVSIHAPLDDASRNLITSKELKMMKSSALLLNLGRGGIINEEDLAKALEQGTIRGAGLDVLWPEPPLPDSPLLKKEIRHRLLLTPHVGWAAIESRQRAINECAANIEAFLQGQRRNRVD